MIVSQAFGTLTPMIAFLLTFFKTDFEPSVATNLHNPRKISKVTHVKSTSRSIIVLMKHNLKMEVRGGKEEYQFRLAELTRTREESSLHSPNSSHTILSTRKNYLLLSARPPNRLSPIKCVTYSHGCRTSSQTLRRPSPTTEGRDGKRLSNTYDRFDIISTM